MASTGSISGQVFNDADGNGKKISSEVGIAKVTMYLDTNNNGKLDNGETKTATDSGGNYSFSGLKAATYLVRQQLPSGMKQTIPTNNFANHVTLKSGGKATNELFGDQTVAPPPPPPSISINDVSHNEGNSGTTGFTFTITRTGDTSKSSVVKYVTANGTASSSSDYTSASSTVTFAAGSTSSKTITINVKGDTTVESDETFLVNLTSVTNATIADGQGVGTIVNDDAAPLPPPSISINDVSQDEGDSGTTGFTFTLTRTGDTSKSSVVKYATANGTASSSSDYTSASSTVTFAAGSTSSKTITINVKGDTTVENDETFLVNLTSVTNATIGDGQGVGTILNDDSVPPPAYPLPGPAGDAPDWAGYGGNAQHTALYSGTVASQKLNKLKWSVTVDQSPVFNGDSLQTHYGSPLITAANTVIVPVKTTSTGAFKVEAFDGSDGSALWTMSTDYILPPHTWIPDFDPTVTASGRVFFAGAGGTIYWRDDADGADGANVASGQIAYYGIQNYTAANKSALNTNVFIDTPITADSAGNIYFGVQVTGSNPLNLKSSLVRIAVDGTATAVSALSAANNDSAIDKPAQNAAPAISNDGKTVYFAVNKTGGGNLGQSADLLALNSTTMKTITVRALLDPVNNARASVPDVSTASPMIGPDGDVYMGTLTGDSNFRGFMLHFNGDLSQVKTTGSFGWDDTASIVPASMVASYKGSSSYLILTKYNDYVQAGGQGLNKLAILDPNDTQTDPLNNIPVMKEVLTVLGPTPDPEHANVPGAVREWCINTAAVDPLTDSVLANSEDGKLYRWDLSTNTLSQNIVLNGGIGESYTPTAIGPDGTVYSINDSVLWAVGE